MPVSKKLVQIEVDVLKGVLINVWCGHYSESKELKLRYVTKFAMSFPKIFIKNFS